LPPPQLIKIGAMSAAANDLGIDCVESTESTESIMGILRDEASSMEHAGAIATSSRAKDRSMGSKLAMLDVATTTLQCHFEIYNLLRFTPESLPSTKAFLRFVDNSDCFD
jgi:hypothetical protein